MIKELMKSIREYKRDSILTPILVSLEVVMECIIPFVVAQLVNEIKAGSGMSVISRYGLILVVMAIMSLAFGAGAGSVCASASCGFAKNLRKDMFYRIQDFSFENIDKFSTSSLVTRMTTDVMNVQLAFMMLIRLAIRSPLMLIFSFTMAFIMGGKMALIFLVVIPILGIGLFAVIHKVGPLFKRVFRKYDALNNSIQENVKGMRVVKSFVREAYEKEKFHHGLSGFHPRGEDSGDQQPSDAVLPVCGYDFCPVLWFLYDHHERRSGSGRWTVFCPFSIQLPDIK